MKNGSNSVQKLALKLRICVRFASTFNVERVAVLTYDLVICKDSNDCLLYIYTIRTFLSISITKKYPCFRSIILLSYR